MRTHRGFTLIELMVALVIMVIVTGAMYKLLNNTQRLSRAQAEQVDLQSNVRTGAIVVPNELREINTVEGGTIGQNDILPVPTSTLLTYRAMRGMGFVCQAPTSSEIRILASTWSGTRAPQVPRDSAYVFLEGTDPDISGDDYWRPVRITAVNLTSTCGGQAAYALTINPTVTALTDSGAFVGTPVRLYEVMALSLYPNGGKWWLGAQSLSANELAPQPVLGPLAADSGLAFEYLDKNGTATADPKSIKSVRLTLRGVTEHAISAGGGSGTRQYVQDRLVSQVLLRNAFRP